MFGRFKAKEKMDKSIAMKEAQKVQYDEDNRVVIEVGLSNLDDFYSPYSYKTYEKMNPEVCEYINDEERRIERSENLALNIYTDSQVSNDEKKRIRQTVKRHYAEEITAIEYQLKRKMSLGLIFCFIGLVILFVEAAVHSLLNGIYIDTIIAVVGWLWLWDGLEIIFYDRGKLKRGQLQNYRIMNAKVHVRMYSKTIQREYGLGEFEEEKKDEQ